MKPSFPRAVATLAAVLGSLEPAYGARPRGRRSAGLADSTLHVTGPPDAPVTLSDPSPRLDLALAGRTPLVRVRRGRPGGENAWYFPAPLERGQCYLLLGAAQSTRIAEADVRGGSVVLAESVPLHLSALEGGIVRQRFCVADATAPYVVRILTRGPVRWDVAVVSDAPTNPAPSSETPDPQAPGAETPSPTQTDPRERTRAQLAEVLTTGGIALEDRESARGETCPRPGAMPDGGGLASPDDRTIGGDGEDLIAGQLREIAGREGIVRAQTPLVRARLGPDGDLTAPASMVGGQCVLAVAAGGPDVRTLRLVVSTPGGDPVAESRAPSPPLSLRWCAPWSGTYRITLTASSRNVDAAIQVLALPAPP